MLSTIDFRPKLRVYWFLRGGVLSAEQPKDDIVETCTGYSVKSLGRHLLDEVHILTVLFILKGAESCDVRPARCLLLLHSLLYETRTTTWTYGIQLQTVQDAIEHVMLHNFQFFFDRELAKSLEPNSRKTNEFARINSKARPYQRSRRTVTVG